MDDSERKEPTNDNWMVGYFQPNPAPIQYDFIGVALR